LVVEKRHCHDTAGTGEQSARIKTDLHIAVEVGHRSRSTDGQPAAEVLAAFDRQGGSDPAAVEPDFGGDVLDEA
jgi:hypothetical protein